MQLKPLRDWVIIKRFDFEHPILYVTGIDLHRGEVVAVGPGRRMRRRRAYKQHGENSSGVQWFEDGPETGQVRPMRVRVGDVVEFGFRGCVEVDVGREKYVFVKEQSVYGVDPTKSRHVAVVEAKSAAVPL